MIIEISVAIAVLIFAILAFFIIRTLFVLQNTLKRVDNTLWDLEMKVKNLDPLLITLSQLGEVCEDKSEQLKKAYFTPRPSEEVKSSSADLVEWLMLSVKLGSKFLKRR